MGGTVRPFFGRLALLLVLATALVAMGFAHRLPLAQNAELAANVHFGGELVDLCGADMDGDGAADHGGCPACHIVAAVVVPVNALSLRDANLIVIATVVASRENRAVRAVLDPARGMRAPL